jgi:hypothetical protein
MPDELKSSKVKKRIFGRKFASTTKDERLELEVIDGPG